MAMNEDFESYNLDDEEEEKEGSDGRLTMWSIVPQIMISPRIGWEKAGLKGPSPDIATVRFLLPLSLLSGAAVFFSLLYPAGQNGLTTGDGIFTVVLVNAVIQFCSFFLGYYLALVMAKAFLPKDIKGLPSSRYGKLLTMTGIASLAFFHIIYEAFLMLDFILVFLPLWTIFIIFKGMEYSDLKSEKSILAIGVMCLVVVVSPTLIEWVLALFA